MAEIFVQVRGTGPAVLLLHGAPSTINEFEGLVKVLEPHFQVLAPEFPGYGRSARLEPYSLDAVQILLESALRRLGLSTLHAAVGYSMGSYRALRLALDGGVRVERLFLLGAIGHCEPSDAPLFQQFADTLRRMTGWTDDFRDLLVQRQLSKTFQTGHPDMVRALRAGLDETTPAVLADECDAIAHFEDLRPRLGAIDVPTIVRIGTEDASVPRHYSEAIAKGSPGAQLQVVWGSGHALHLEDAEATTAAVLAFSEA